MRRLILALALVFITLASGMTTPASAAVVHPTATDTGYTRIRLTIDSNSAWATFTLDGAEIKASKIVSEYGARVTSLGPSISVAGRGTAVVDFVFQIPHGVTTTVTSCRNYQGGLGITFTRMTDAPTQVTRVVDLAKTSQAQPGQCEYYLRTPISRADLIGPVRWPARNDSRRLVLSTYFPWYNATALTRDFGDNPTGPANTGDPAQVAQMLDMAQNAGVDGFIVEWEGMAQNEARAQLVFDEATRRGNFYTALQLDLEILSVRLGGLLPVTLDTALNAVADRAAYASQLRIDGEPVVFVFGAALTTAQNWSAALDRLATNRGVRPFVIANADNLGAPGRYEFGNLSPDRASLFQYAADIVYQRKLAPAVADTSGPLWVGPVSPGYDESRLNRPRTTVIPRANGLRFWEEWSSMLTSLPDWVLVTSWNEYFEQSHVMPGTTTGNKALTQLKNWATYFHTYG